MIASVHIANVGVRRALQLLRQPPAVGDVPGLRDARIGLTAPLGRSPVKRPSLSRVALFSFWDDDEALDAFVAKHPVAQALGDGWHARLEPLRAWGSWPGLPEDLSRHRVVPSEGPMVVLTLARFRLNRALSFFNTSAKAEGAVVQAPGLVWGTGVASPPFVATCSVWQDAQALSTYAYGRRQPAHARAIEADQARPFHHQSAFVRFRPSVMEGSLSGRNPLRSSGLLQ
jgi:hypothetical protein